MDDYEDRKLCVVDIGHLLDKRIAARRIFGFRAHILLGVAHVWLAGSTITVIRSVPPTAGPTGRAGASAASP